MKKITLCADDYSFTPGISEAILTLAKHHRISATSCMTNTPNWDRWAKQLIPYREKLDVGLHLTFTDVPPITTKVYTLKALILKAYARQLDFHVIKNEIKKQIEKFQNALGMLPHFIDGHQHIHQLPIIRQALLSVYQDTFQKNRCYIRVPSNFQLSFKRPLSKAIKSNIITMTGSIALKHALVKQKIPFNHSFSGIYDFSNAKQYPLYFHRFINEIKSGGLIMCHPGSTSKNSMDDIAKQRQHEYNYLMSDAFLEACQQFEIQLARFQANHL